MNRVQSYLETRRGLIDEGRRASDWRWDDLSIDFLCMTEEEQSVALSLERTFDNIRGMSSWTWEL